MKIVTRLNNKEAKKFFLKSESYANFDLPNYFDFSDLLNEIEKTLDGQDIKNFVSGKPKDFSDVNHVILSNKDGKYSWRPFELIHPVLYVDLVNTLTEENAWKKLQNHFKKSQKSSKIICLSLPVESETKKSDKAQQVIKWWQDVELNSIEHGLDFDYCFETDISDCYGSIYTHSLHWAIEGFESAKRNQNDGSLGNKIDVSIRNMRYGQTNGIPQGSVLMDFIAEILLAYIDRSIMIKLRRLKVFEYRILRYRDDYRIFVESPEIGNKILKTLSELLARFGLKLNALKTRETADIVLSSVKQDKIVYSGLSVPKNKLLKRILLIKYHSEKFPNSGSLVVALSKFHNKVSRQKQLKRQSMPIVSVVIDIAVRNPRTYPLCFAIVSKYLSMMTEEKKKAVVDRVRKKFSKVSNTGFMEIWLQRVTKDLTDSIYDEKLCHLDKNLSNSLWNSSWISFKKLKNVIEKTPVHDSKIFSELDEVITKEEVQLFHY